MKIEKFGRTTMCMVLVTAFAVSGCATPPGQNTNVASTGTECNALAGALAGALLGAFVNGRNGALAGGAIGALACLAINATTRQTRTAQQVETDYRQVNGGQLPDEPKVVNYQTSMTPESHSIQRGDQVSVTSNMNLVAGRNKNLGDVTETLRLLDKNGKQITTKTKPMSEVSGSGGYENKFNFSIPKGSPQGTYAVTTELSINGKSQGIKRDRLQVVVADGRPQVLAYAP